MSASSGTYNPNSFMQSTRNFGSANDVSLTVSAKSQPQFFIVQLQVSK